MGNYDQLKNAVAAVIYDNGAEYITGDRLQDVLVTIINSVGAGATFAGVALPNTNPGTPDPKMFYLAGKAGTYTNFNVTITKGLWVFTNDGGTWTGTDLQVSMLFATGEDVTETSIAGDITQGASDDIPTVGAVLGALEAEDDKFFNEVAYGDIDDLATFDEAFAGSESGTPAYYTVYVMVNSHKVKVGTMEIISDNMAHVVTQVMVTHYVLDENGAITGAHSDGDLFRIFRSKKIHGGTLPTDDWTPWAYVNETEWKKIVSGADAVPTPDSEKLVKSGGVAAAIESLETADETIQGTFFNEVAFEDLGNIKLYIDTLAGSQSGTPAYYTVYKAVGDDKVKVGTLQVISDSSRGVLTQVLETHYTLDRIARSVTYSGGLVSLWSPWSYVNGSIVDAAVAEVEAEVNAKTGKIIYRSIFQDTATGSLIPRIDTVIKELYISAADLGDNDASKYCVQNIRRNVSGTWYVDLYYYDNGTVTQALRFNSVKKTGELEAIRTSNESYCVIDWSLLADGESIYIAPGDVGAYLLDGAYVSDVDNFPISKSVAFQRSAGANISRLNLSVTTLQETVDEVEKSVFPVATTVGRFVRTDGTFGTAAAAQRLRWCMSGLIPLDYFQSENSVMYGSTDNIVLKNCYHREGSSAPYCLFYDESETPLTGEGAYITAPGESKADITLVWGGNIPDTAKYVRINFYQDGYIENLLPEGGGGGTADVEEYFVEKFNKYAVSWIDDDFHVVESDGVVTILPEMVKDICDSLGSKCDFAVIPSSDKSWSGDDDYPTDDEQFIPQEKADIIKAWQREGFHFQLHPIHKGWYNSPPNSSTNYIYQGVAFCEQSLVKCMEAFRDAGIFNDPCIVYPGGSGSTTEVVNMVKRWVEFGVTGTTDSDPYNAGVKNPFNIRRMFLNFESPTAATKTHTVDYYKAQVDAAFAAGAWIIFGTHSAQITDDTSDPTTDNWRLTVTNVKKVVQYALSKRAGTKVEPVRKVWNRRKMMLELYTD